MREMILKGYLLDSNLVIGINKEEKEAIERFSHLGIDENLYVLDITENESSVKEKNKKSITKLKNRNCIVIKSVKPLTINNKKKEQFWKWDELLLKSNLRLDAAIDSVMEAYGALIDRTGRGLDSKHKNDLEIVLNAIYYNLKLVTLDKKMEKKYVHALTLFAKKINKED